MPSTTTSAATLPDPVDGDAAVSSPFSLHHAVHARRDEYVRRHRMRVKVGTWNVAGLQGTDKDLASWFVDGKGVDRRLATLDLARNSALERERSLDSLDPGPDPNAVRLLGGDKIGMYVLGLQEVVDLNVAAQYMRGVYSDSSPSAMERWKTALEEALPPGYVLVAADQMSGLLLLIYASPEVAATISDVSTSAVGTGLLGYMGNKGAVSARVVVGEATRMTFVNCHLASGHDSTSLGRRLWDVGQILSRTQFKPVPAHPGADASASPERIGDEDFAFWFGDLNFRLDLPGEDIRRLLLLHTRGEYDVQANSKDGDKDTALDGEEAVVLPSSSHSSSSLSSFSSSSKTESGGGGGNGSSHGASDDLDSSAPLPDPNDFLPDPSNDPASLQATLDSLVPHDQLRMLIKQQRVFHQGWREGPITFLPSYKYDVGTVSLFDTSEKKRAPSWCDRILFRSRRDKEIYDKKARDAAESQRRDEELKSRGVHEATEDDEVLFDYDPETDGDDPPAKSIDTSSLSNNGGSSITTTTTATSKVVFDYDEYNDDEDGNIGDEESADQDRLHLDIYTSHQRIQSSDHKPVVSVFSIDYDAVVPELKTKVHADAARQLDRAENEARPVITIVVDNADRGKQSNGVSAIGDAIAIDFGNVFYLRPKTSYMTIANTGRVTAKFSFVKRPAATIEDGHEEEEEGEAGPQFIATSFVRTDLGAQSGDSDAVNLGNEVTLDPGETVKAVVRVSVDEIRQVTCLNDGSASLEDVLVLRVENGRDHFIPVKATWMATCIGRSIDELIRVPDGGIRAFLKELSENKAKDKDKYKSSRVGSIAYECEVHCAAPKELFKLTEAVETLAERVLADEQMLQIEVPRHKEAWPFPSVAATKPSQNPELLAAVIDLLDRDKPVAEAFEPEVGAVQKLEVVAEVLLLFLRGLTDGIVTIPLWTRIEQASLPSLAPGVAGTGANHAQGEDDKTAVLDILSTAPNHNISFVFLTTTLAKVIAELVPLTKAEIELANAVSGGASSSSGRAPVALARRSLSFRRGGQSEQTAEALAALERRQAKERHVAEVLVRSGKVCRASSASTREKERRATEERQRALLELFLRLRLV